MPAISILKSAIAGNPLKNGNFIFVSPDSYRELLSLTNMKDLFKKLWKIFLKCCLWFFILSIVSTVLFRWLPVPVTPLMLIQCTEQMFDSKREIKLKKEWVSLDEISPNLQLAVMCSEDQNFLEHNGFDFDAIEKAMKHN